MRRALAWGAVAAAAYLGSALLSGALGIGLRPLFDGFAPPQPYRWVSPPPDLAPQNVPPVAGDGTIEFTPEGSNALTVTTGDGQAIAIFRQGTFEPVEGATGVRVTITPLAASRVPQAPEGLEVAGNAYRVEAEYVPTGGEAEPGRELDIVLRYPVHADVVLRAEGDAWERLSTETAPGTLIAYATATELGTFASAAAPQGGTAWVRYAIIGAAAVIAAATGYFLGRRRGGAGSPQKRDAGAPQKRGAPRKRSAGAPQKPGAKRRRKR